MRMGGAEKLLYKCGAEGLGGSSWKLAGGEAGWEGKLGEEAEEELSEGGGGREGGKEEEAEEN